MRLAPERLASVASSSLEDVPRVVFGCTRNSARSQLAAAIWAWRSRVPAVSAGTRPAERVHPRAVRVARRRGLQPDAWRTDSSYDQFATGSTIPNFLPLLAERFARQRLTALALQAS